LVPIIGSQSGLMSSFNAYPSGLPGVASTANYNYTLGFGPFGALQPWQTNETTPAKYKVDANVITGGSGTDIIFGSIGDDVVHAGSGTEQINAGWGFNTIYGGTAAKPAGLTDTIVYNRSTDKVILSNIKGVAASALNTSPGSSILAATWTSSVGTTLAVGMAKGASTTTVIKGLVSAPAVMPVVPYIAPTMEAAAPTLVVSGAGASYFAASSIPPVDPYGPNFSHMQNAGRLIVGSEGVIRTAAAEHDDDAIALALDPDLVQTVSDVEGNRAGRIIQAMRNSEIFVRFDDEEQTVDEAIAWLFDEAEGVFAPMASAPIVVEAADAATDQVATRDGGGEDAYEAYVVDNTWLAALRRLGRQATRNLFDA
ncbi:MAG: hypothetical protein P4L98_10155, partial [Ancalomicrobiaceae bacterium]|nr:hypothetical protein [Ancalomicrobiaceae bacterium]